LNEYFSLHFTGRLKTSKAEGSKVYQFAIISDDGAIFSIYNGSRYQEIVNNDGTHSAKLACSAIPVKVYPFTALSIPFKLDYYQGPRSEIALILMYREWTDNTVEEPLCGTEGSAYWFNPVNSAPQDPYKQLLTRGWKPVPDSMIFLNTVSSHNPCM
jgi:hypothetical protein